MPNWKYIATKLSGSYSSPKGPLGGRWTEEHIHRCWEALFDFKYLVFHNKETMYGNLATIFDFIMTIGNRPGLEDYKKVEKILTLLQDIAGRIDYDEAVQIFKGGGYDLKIRPEDEQYELEEYGSFHKDILVHCEKFFKQKDFSTCVNEACKAYNKAVQVKSNNSVRDGQDLMHWAFGDKGPIRVNSYNTQSEKNEQEGIRFMSVGLMCGFRNPTAHETALSWKITQRDCLDILGLASYLFKRLEKASVLP